METLFLSERENTQLFRTSKIFEIDALFVKLEGFLCLLRYDDTMTKQGRYRYKVHPFKTYCYIGSQNTLV